MTTNAGSVKKAARRRKDVTPQPPEGFTRGNDRIARMLAKPGIAEAVADIHEEMAVADRAHAMGLRTLREAADLTQKECAAALGVGQSSVARAETRGDMLLSTLANYLEVLGGTMQIVVSFEGGRRVELDLPLTREHRTTTRPGHAKA